MSEIEVENFVRELKEKNRLQVENPEPKKRQIKDFFDDDVEEKAVNGLRAFFQDLKKKLSGSEVRNGKIFQDGQTKVVIPSQKISIRESEIQEFVDTMKRHSVEIDVIQFYGDKNANY